VKIEAVSSEFATEFLNANHPLRAGGSLRGQVVCLAGFEYDWPMFLAVFVWPRARWKNYSVMLELSRLAWSPLCRHSASTFLRQCVRILRRTYSGLIVTYALPGTEGILYERAGFYHDGYSGGASWSKRGPGERLTPETIGTGRKLKRYFVDLGEKCGSIHK